MFSLLFIPNQGTCSTVIFPFVSSWCFTPPGNFQGPLTVPQRKSCRESVFQNIIKFLQFLLMLSMSKMCFRRHNLHLVFGAKKCQETREMRWCERRWLGIRESKSKDGFWNSAASGVSKKWCFKRHNSFLNPLIATRLCSDWYGRVLKIRQARVWTVLEWEDWGWAVTLTR